MRERYRNRKFEGERVELDGKEFEWCEFRECLIVLRSGDTALERCRFHACRLLLQGNAYTVGRVIRLFTGEKPLKVLDITEPIYEEAEAAEVGTGEEAP